jgi:hypothetical protein
MADTAAHLVDNVFPHVPVRQWVLSLPFEIRYRMCYDKQLISDVLAVFQRAVQGWYRNKAKELDFINVQGGSVSFIQKFGSSLNVTPHYHCLLLDGVYGFSNDSNEPFFVATPAPTDEDVKQLAETVAAKVIRLLERRGVIGEQDTYDAFSEDNPVLAGMTAASVHGMIATGDRAGLPVRRILSDPATGIRTSHLCYVSRGFSLHAARRVDADDRTGLEQLCSYVTRPPLAAGSLEKVADDKYLFKSKPPSSLSVVPMPFFKEPLLPGSEKGFQAVGSDSQTITLSCFDVLSPYLAFLLVQKRGQTVKGTTGSEAVV